LIPCKLEQGIFGEKTGKTVFRTGNFVLEPNASFAAHKVLIWEHQVSIDDGHRRVIHFRELSSERGLAFKEKYVRSTPTAGRQPQGLIAVPYSNKTWCPIDRSVGRYWQWRGPEPRQFVA
jgi:hypothetical protein